MDYNNFMPQIIINFHCLLFVVTGGFIGLLQIPSPPDMHTICLQAILDCAIFNWYSNSVQALTSEMYALYSLTSCLNKVYFCLTVFGVPSSKMKQVSVRDSNCNSTEDMYF